MNQLHEGEHMSSNQINQAASYTPHYAVVNMESDIIGHSSARRLQAELVRNPPPYSKLPGAPISNALVMASDDPAMAARIDWLNIQSMTALIRFGQRLAHLNRIGRQKDLGSADIQVLEAYGEDFYDTWSVSSSEIIHALGMDLTLEVLRVLRDFFYLTWPATSLDFLEERQLRSGPSQIFRGQCRASRERPVVDGLSWSLSRSTARYYANRIDGGVVYQTSVEFRDILLYREDELEVVIDSTLVSIGNSEGYLRATVIEEA
jgi:hypothetical protein